MAGETAAQWLVAKPEKASFASAQKALVQTTRLVRVGEYHRTFFKWVRVSQKHETLLFMSLKYHTRLALQWHIRNFLNLKIVANGVMASLRRRVNFLIRLENLQVRSQLLETSLNFH